MLESRKEGGHHPYLSQQPFFKVSSPPAGTAGGRERGEEGRVKERRLTADSGRLRQTLRDRWMEKVCWYQGAWSMDGPESLSSKSLGSLGSALGSGNLQIKKKKKKVKTPACSF